MKGEVECEQTFFLSLCGEEGRSARVLKLEGCERDETLLVSEANRMT